MSEEFSDSFKKVIKERVSSPLYGSFLISWLIINWQVIYVTLFESKESLGKSKLIFIQEFLTTQGHLFTIYIPVVMAILFITIGPIATYFALIIPEKYKHRRLVYRDMLKRQQYEEIYKSKINSLSETIKIKETEINELRSLITDINSISRFFKGEWELRRTKNDQTTISNLFHRYGNNMEEIRGNVSLGYSTISDLKQSGTRLEFTMQNSETGFLEKFVLALKPDTIDEYSGLINSSDQVTLSKKK